MKHPAKKVRGKALWFGPEVEGTLQRVHTAFVRCGLNKEDTKRLLDRDGLQQVFLTEEFQDWRWLKSVWNQLYSCVVITKACYPRDVAKLKRKLLGIRLFVRVDAKWVHKLSGGDQISLGVPYDLYATRVDHMVYTSPSDYEQDVP